MSERLNSLWVGNCLGYIEQLCLISALATGHHFTLYSYDPKLLQGVPSGIDVCDAREVMSKEGLVSYSDSGSPVLGTNFFRYALIAKGLGYWVDMDFCFLKPIEFDEPYVFGWEYENQINGAIIRIPSHSQMARDLRDLPKTNRRPPWFGPKRSANYYWKRLTQGDVRVEDHPWGTFGPGMVTYLAKKHRVSERAQKPPVFYPVRWRDARALFAPAHIVESMLRPETRAIHMYHSQLVDLVDRPPPQGSYLDMVCRRYGVSTLQPVPRK